jgi:hypothetical protein
MHSIQLSGRLIEAKKISSSAVCVLVDTGPIEVPEIDYKSDTNILFVLIDVPFTAPSLAGTLANTAPTNNLEIILESVKKFPYLGMTGVKFAHYMVRTKMEKGTTAPDSKSWTEKNVLRTSYKHVDLAMKKGISMNVATVLCRPTKLLHTGKSKISFSDCNYRVDSLELCPSVPILSKNVAMDLNQKYLIHGRIVCFPNLPNYPPELSRHGVYGDAIKET